MGLTGGTSLDSRSPFEGASIVYGCETSAPAARGDCLPTDRRQWTRVKVGGQYYQWFDGEQPPVSLDHIDPPDWAAIDPAGWQRAIEKLKASNADRS
jgi:hypothetical protein